MLAILSEHIVRWKPLSFCLSQYLQLNPRLSNSSKWSGLPIGLLRLFPHYHIKAGAVLITKNEACIVIICYCIHMESAFKINSIESCITYSKDVNRCMKSKPSAIIESDSLIRFPPTWSFPHALGQFPELFAAVDESWKTMGITILNIWRTTPLEIPLQMTAGSFGSKSPNPPAPGRLINKYQLFYAESHGCHSNPPLSTFINNSNST